jgi:hypothetical protein
MISANIRIRNSPNVESPSKIQDISKLEDSGIYRETLYELNERT